MTCLNDTRYMNNNSLKNRSKTLLHMINAAGVNELDQIMIYYVAAPGTWLSNAG